MEDMTPRRPRDDARAQLGQISWTARRYRSPRRLVTQLGVIRRMDLPRLPEHRGARTSVWGVSVVRDEADVVGATVRHLLAQEIDHLLIADNGSTDGTAEVLRSIADADPRVHVAVDREVRHVQSEKITYLAHRAWRAGADWVLPFDADEWFFAPGQAVGAFLRESRASVMHAAFHHMVPTEPVTAIGPETVFVLDSTPAFPGKVAVRSHPLLEVLPGNHGASRVGAVSDGLHIAHALYRHPDQIARKFRQGMDASTDSRTLPGEHWRKGAMLTDSDIADVWGRISAGLPDARIDYRAIGPMVQVRPLAWRTWDPDGVVPIVAAATEP